MKRKDFNLLVEGWRNFLNESFNSMTDNEFLKKNKTEIEKLDGENKIEVPDELKKLLSSNAKSSNYQEDNSYRIDFVIAMLLQYYVSDKQKNKALDFSAAMNPQGILINMINFLNEDKKREDFMSYVEKCKIEELTAEVKKYVSLLKEFDNFKKSQSSKTF
tara:strand:- start:445 stop:927 length:483 start_codon:yes stop_codon:yes gene_type:complete